MIDLADKLKNVMKKDITSTWTKQHIDLGLGLGKVQGLEKIQIILDEIEDFGIDMESLDAIEPTYDELYEIYQAIITYRNSVKYLKKLKGKFQSKEMERS